LPWSWQESLKEEMGEISSQKRSCFSIWEDGPFAPHSARKMSTLKTGFGSELNQPTVRRAGQFVVVVVAALGFFFILFVLFCFGFLFVFLFC
jgi:hypothetical protein